MTSTHTYDAVLPQFTGKERDAESGLDNFGARYNSSSLGRFMSPDPVVITPERFFDPQQLNAYAYVRNNPLRFIDPTGEVLICNGSDQAACLADLRLIAGDAASRVSVDPKTGVVSFDAKDLDLTKNEGANLINNLVTSTSNYGFSVGDTTQTKAGPVRVDYISNLPLFTDQVANRKCKCMGDNERPSNVDDQLVFNPNNPRISHRSNTKLSLAEPYTVVFHELAEAYEKIDGGHGDSYATSHNAAVLRENKLRDQRPNLQGHNPGSGGPANSPGDSTMIIIRK